MLIGITVSAGLTLGDYPELDAWMFCIPFNGLTCLVCFLLSDHLRPVSH